MSAEQPSFWCGKTVLIFGAGYSGKAFAKNAHAEGATVFGTTRSPDKMAPEIRAYLNPVQFDGEATDELRALIKKAHIIVQSVSPGEAGDPVVNAMGEALADASPNWMAYLSTVGVYGSYDGGWVDETARPRPVSKRSVQRVAAEDAWQRLAETNSAPLAILRLSGIYGPGRNAFCNLEKGTARRLVKPGQVFNRIHVDDIASSLMFLGEQQADGIFNVTDNLPAPPQDVVEHAALLMKVDVPPPIDFETATLSPMARSFYGENKRVSNAKLKELGFDFDYPDYKTAFNRMWADHTWRG
ncbi:MAG: SDR family oxidoreductase [Pseudomonadota bacterium]